MRTLAGVVLACVAGLGGCTPEDIAPMFDAGADEPDAMESNAPEECNTIENDCPVELPKCTVIQRSDGRLETECLPVTGTNVDGATCMREGNNAVGRDNCDIGLFCSGLAIAPMGDLQPRVCRSFCVVDADCTGPGGDTCLDFGIANPANPSQPHPGVEGLCVPSCILFEACAEGLSCSLNANNDGMTLFGLCRPLGAMAAGESCTSSNECAADLTCLFDGAGNGECVPNCDDAHPCTAPATCVTEDTGGPFGLPNGGGFCSG